MTDGSGASPARDGDTRLAEIAARAAAATPGPWFVEPEQASDTSYTPARVAAPGSVDYWSGDCDDVQLAVGAPADMEFIAAARTDVPWLLAEVENGRKAFCGHCGNYHPVIHHACCEPTMRANDERDAAVAALNRVRALCNVLEHICTDTCEAFGCDNKGVTYIRSVQDILAAADVPDATAAGETG